MASMGGQLNHSKKIQVLFQVTLALPYHQCVLFSSIVDMSYYIVISNVLYIIPHLNYAVKLVYS